MKTLAPKKSIAPVCPCRPHPVHMGFVGVALQRLLRNELVIWLSVLSFVANGSVAAESAVVPLPGVSSAVQSVPVVRVAEPARPTTPLGDDVLTVACSDEQETTIGSTETEGRFTFVVCNVSAADLTVLSATASCGCTSAKLPSVPWKLAPGEAGSVEVTMKTFGRTGTIAKTVTLQTDLGIRILRVRTNVVEPPRRGTMEERQRNQTAAMADRQAVFKGDCARCHVEPAAGKRGVELFVTACGICHEATPRASLVPDLRAKPGASEEYWRQWITHGRAGSLMPAFSMAEGGPLTEQQIRELAGCLTQGLPFKATAPMKLSPAPVFHP